LFVSRIGERPVVCFVVGTRPEAIKIAPVVLAAREDGRLTPCLVSSGQHGAPVDQALTAFALVPDRTIAPRRETGSLAELTALLAPLLDNVFAELAPAAVVVQGDTTSALVAALVAFWRRIPVVHVEAGLRSGDLAAPFPEEANRILVDHLSALHLAPTPAAACHLAAEGIAGDRVIVTGNTVVDAIEHVAGRNLPYDDPRLDEIEASGRRLVLVTVHRRESWGEPIRRVLGAVRRLVEEFPDIAVVLPAHPNPAVREDVETALDGVDRVVVCDPLPYGALARLLARSYLVLSDSGGIQEEGPTFGVPVLVLREVTERREALDAGCAVLVGTDADRVRDVAAKILAEPTYRARMVAAGNPFGDGLAAPRTVAGIAWLLDLGRRPEPFDPTPRGAR
jgi:UDP-N-acetylglucosamine 2-epimerase (non-hydrolysing)